MSTLPLPDKQFFKIGEAADIVGVKAHVLRYWESEFPALRPLKTRGAHRMYRRADVELACVIRRLLHEEGYTIPGAKKRVRELQAQRQQPAQPLNLTPPDAEAGGLPELQLEAQLELETAPPRESLVQIRRPAAEPPAVDAQAARELKLRAELIHLRAELAALLESLDQSTEGQSPQQAAVTATVTAVVPKTVLIQQRSR